MSDEQAAKLRELAERATPGPWRIVTEPGQLGDGETRTLMAANGDMLMCDMPYYPDAFSSDADWQYVAAASPDVVTALLDALDEARAERDAAMALLRAAREELLGLDAFLIGAGESRHDVLTLLNRIDALLGDGEG